MRSPLVKCVCGYEHILSEGRTSDKEAIICHSCFRSLKWQDGKPIARRAIMRAGVEGAVKWEIKELTIVGYVNVQ